MTQQQSSVVAIDLGSNSFHLLEATLDQRGALKPLNAMARKVQLALDMREDRLSDAAISRGLDCLREFAPFCRHRPTAGVSVVGTQALRKAANRQVFIAAAEQLLNHPIDIISGDEEARLAYGGVAADSSVASHHLFVVDIGGGSTELVAGLHGEIREVASLQLGCVSWLDFFPEGRLSAASLNAAKIAASQLFDAAAHRFTGDWQITGCSGTLLAVAEVLRQNHSGDGTITRAGLEQLQQALLAFEHIEAVRFQGLMEHRRNIFASGVSIVSALFESLGVQRMVLSSYGLREGVAWELLHRQQRER